MGLHEQIKTWFSVPLIMINLFTFVINTLKIIYQ